MDYQRILPTLNIATNDVHCRRQFNSLSFDAHVLSDESSIVHVYDESDAGADDACTIVVKKSQRFSDTRRSA